MVLVDFDTPMPDLVKDLADISKNDVALALVSEGKSAPPPPRVGWNSYCLLWISLLLLLYAVYVGACGSRVQWYDFLCLYSYMTLQLVCTFQGKPMSDFFLRNNNFCVPDVCGSCTARGGMMRKFAAVVLFTGNLP